MQDRIGLYCWAGPGTIRMLRLKYFYPLIDQESVMSSYDYDVLGRMQDRFGITDVWATYSWGFSPYTEQEDYRFLAERIQNFHKLGIKVHAYLQGPNLVYDEFPDRLWWSVDNRGRLISYHRGRRAVNLLHPDFVEYKLGQIDDVAEIGVDGVFIDNVYFGQLPEPIYRGDVPFTFAGCNHPLTQREFKNRTGKDIPLDFEKDKELAREYLGFRTDVTMEFLGKMSQRVHKHGLEFGSNSFDPKFNTHVVYGTDLKRVADAQDYVLFENHSLPTRDGSKSNSYIQTVVPQLKKPTFVVSYKKGIGRESEFTQDDIDLTFTEAKYSDFNVCLKGSEFTTAGFWHNLNPDNYQKPHDLLEMPLPKVRELSDKLEKAFVQFPLIKRLVKRYYNNLIQFYFESRIGRHLLDFIYYAGMR